MSKGISSITVSSLPHKGSVYFLHRGAGFGKRDNHFMVVLVPDCDLSHCIVVGIVTSKVEKRKLAAEADGFDPGTVVTIKKSDYPKKLRVDSAVDCNHAQKITRAFFDKLISNADICPDLPEHVADDILRGLIKSKNISDSVRNLAKALITTKAKTST